MLHFLESFTKPVVHNDRSTRNAENTIPKAIKKCILANRLLLSFDVSTVKISIKVFVVVAFVIFAIVDDTLFERYSPVLGLFSETTKEDKESISQP